MKQNTSTPAGDPKLFKAMSAEFIGTFMLVFVGTGAILVARFSTWINELFIGAAFGGTVALCILWLRHLSGAHFNPAVTFAFLLRRELKPIQAGFFVAAQLAGALCASLLLLTIFGNVQNLGATLPTRGTPIALITEVILTLLLVRIILVGAKSIRSQVFFAVMVGLTIAICSILGGDTSGASMNPARSFGPAFASANFQDFWIYWIGPAIGSLIAIGSIKTEMRL